MDLLSYLKEKPLLLAPMAGVTDYPFRSFMKGMECGIVTTELVSATALVRQDNRTTQKYAQISSDQSPVGIQIFGENVNDLSEAAHIVEKMGADFLDLNLGCPVPKIVKKGAGSAILKDLSLLSRILKSIKSKIKIPLTIKIRTGWDDSSRNALEVIRIAYNEGCSWVTIHGRTRSQGYSGQSDWPYIAEVKSQSPLPIIGNGDLVHPQQIKDLFVSTKCDGMMIGRGALKNPWIFHETYDCINNQKNKYDKNIKKVLEDLFYQLDRFHNERMALVQFKKFSTWFSSGYSNSALFRKTIFQLKEKQEVLNYALDYFHKIEGETKEHQPYEDFLMQGHG